MTTYKSIKSIMDMGLDVVTLLDQPSTVESITQQNIRGGGNYAEKQQGTVERLQALRYGQSTL
jgi:hypothetical protein